MEEVIKLLTEMEEANKWSKLFIEWGESALNATLAYSPKVIVAILIMAAGYHIAKLARIYIAKILTKITNDETLSRFLARVIYVAIIVLTVITALANLGIQTASIIAVLGTAGLAIALSLKDSLSNLASGIMLIVFRHFTKGDIVELSGIVGTVEEISLFHTKVVLPDNKIAVLPNSAIASSKIVNFTQNPTRRLEWIFSISYDADIKRAKEVILEELAKDTRIIDTQPTFVGVNALGASAIDIVARAWVGKDDVFNVQTSINEMVKIALDRENIEIPYNKLDVNLIQRIEN